MIPQSKELAHKQKLEREAKQNPAHVYTIAQQARRLGKKRI
jgi:ribosomal protein L39E